MAIANKKRASPAKKPKTFYHILLSPDYALATITVNVTWMKRGCNACKMPRRIYTSIFRCFPVN